jgi:hypothetical protein
MAYYVFLDHNNIVTEVITGIDETKVIEGLAPEIWYENFRGLKCIRTSYNGKIRFNYAGIGYTYDEVRDAFIAPKTYPSWVLDTEECVWKAPVAAPEIEFPIIATWNEEKVDWDIIDTSLQA